MMTRWNSPISLLTSSSALLALGLILGLGATSVAQAGPLLAGVAKADVTSRTAGPPADTLYVKVLVLKDDNSTAALITVDAVAIGEIGPIRNTYLPNVRARLKKELGIEAQYVLANASHCHGIVSDDIDQKTVEAVKEAMKNLVPVRAGTGVGREDRVQENRRLILKNGREADVRKAYSLPPDEAVAAVGPIDPEIGILRLDREDGRPLAVVYNFACHPIQGVPSGGNTADLTGYASQVIEDGLGEGAMALFVQGCGGDINPVRYKDVSNPSDAEALGNLLGLSTLRAAKKIRTKNEATLKVIHETLELPRADLSGRVDSLQAEQLRLLQSLSGTSLNLKTFMPLAVKYSLDPEYPSYYSHRYLQDKARGRDDVNKLDADNRRNLKAYLANIHVMEQMSRNQVNLALLKKHQAQFIAAGRRALEVEVVGVRVGDFVLVTFPGELTVQIGLNIKKASPHKPTFVAGYTNGYIYYTPTAQQMKNQGYAQEDSDCIVTPEWQALFEKKVAEVLKRL